MDSNLSVNNFYTIIIMHTLTLSINILMNNFIIIVVIISKITLYSFYFFKNLYIYAYMLTT